LECGVKSPHSKKIKAASSRRTPKEYLMRHTITLIPGDGIGPEVTAATLRVIEAAGVEIRWEKYAAGAEALGQFGTPLPDNLLASIRRTRVALKGPVTTPIGTGFTSVNVGLRKALDLYANLRPVKSLPGVKSRYENIDLIVVRENTEDLYSGLEHVVVPGVVESLKVITEVASTRISRFACDYARKHKRRKVTAVHKANIMKLSDGLFLDCFRKVSQHYPEIEPEDKIVDNACMQLVMYPERFDVLLMENLYGDILSDLCTGLVGGLGVVPGANIGDNMAVFEAVHGSAPDIAGQGLANPTALIMTAIMMLDHISEVEAARNIEKALFEVLAEGKQVTRDLGGTASTMQFTEAIASRLEAWRAEKAEEAK
jgi:isocitrate dehydrogenase (NAD+)